MSGEVDGGIYASACCPETMRKSQQVASRDPVKISRYYHLLWAPITSPHADNRRGRQAFSASLKRLHLPNIAQILKGRAGIRTHSLFPFCSALLVLITENERRTKVMGCEGWVNRPFPRGHWGQKGVVFTFRGLPDLWEHPSAGCSDFGTGFHEDPSGLWSFFLKRVWELPGWALSTPSPSRSEQRCLFEK